MKLEQGQMWRHEGTFIRLVKLERLAVLYKAINDMETGAGTHHRVTKKEFCRLIKPLPIFKPEEAVVSESIESDER